MISPPASLCLNGLPVVEAVGGIIVEHGTVPALVTALRSIPDNVRLNFWFGNPFTGQSFGHARSQWGCYVSLRPLSRYVSPRDAARCAGWRCFRMTKRIKAESDYPLATESLLLVTTAGGTHVHYKHPLYCPVHDWTRARLEVNPRDADAGLCVYAPLIGEVDERLAHGLLPTANTASQFLRVVKLSDTPSPARHELLSVSARSDAPPDGLPPDQ